jgi:hypothetical protein
VRKTTFLFLLLAIAVLLAALGGIVGIDGLSDGHW